jgi:hypothetical protein
MLVISSPVTLGRRELAPRKEINNNTFLGKSSESSTAPTILDQVIEVLQCTHAPYVMPPSTRAQAAQSTTFRNDIVKCDEIPHKKRLELWPDVFHPKNFLQTKWINKGHAAKIASETNPGELTYTIVFGFAQMHGEEG